MLIANVNWIAIIVATIINMILGFLWYGKPLFGKQWQQEQGWSDKEMKKKQSEMGSSSYILMTIASILSAYVLSQVIALTGATTLGSGAAAGLWVWFGFVTTTQIGKVLWDGKSWKLFSIETGYSFVSYALMGMILVAI